MLGEDGSLIADYTRRRGVIHSEIVSPAQRPDWALVRNTLWIEAAKAESRRNSIEAREFQAAIPAGLSADQAQILAREFAAQMVEKHRFVIDISIHKDNRKAWDGEYKNFEGYHVHFLATTRRITDAGFREKTRELDVKSSGLVRYWREQWANTANAALARSGSLNRIDHRSHKDRMIDRKPTTPLGPKFTALERRGIKTSRGDVLRQLNPGK